MTFKAQILIIARLHNERASFKWPLPNAVMQFYLCAPELWARLCAIHVHSTGPSAHASYSIRSFCHSLHTHQSAFQTLSGFADNPSH